MILQSLTCPRAGGELVYEKINARWTGGPKVVGETDLKFEISENETRFFFPVEDPRSKLSGMTLLRSE